MAGKKITKEEWQERSDVTHGRGKYTILNVVKGASGTSLIRCNKCNTPFTQTLNRHTSKGHGCASCAAPPQKKQDYTGVANPE